MVINLYLWIFLFGVKGPNLLSQYLEALKDYEDNLMDIENVEKYDAGSEGIVYFIKIGKRCVQFTPQQAEIEITENGCIVTKIN